MTTDPDELKMQCLSSNTNKQIKQTQQKRVFELRMMF